MRRFVAASLIVLVLSGAAAAFSPEGQTPRAAPAVGEVHSFTFANGVYAVALAWSDVPGPATGDGRVFTGTIAHAGRVAAFDQRLVTGDVFGRAGVAEPFFVEGAESVTAEGDPVLTLRLSRAPGSPRVPELLAYVQLTFQESSILHTYEMHFPYVVFANTVTSTTTLAWDSPFDARGSLHPNGTTQDDDGRSLDPYGAWEASATYGVFARDADTLVGHARLAQGQMVNYLVEGSFRASTTGSVVTAAFSPLLDAPSAGLVQDLLVRDAIVFPANATPAGMAGDIAALAEEGGEEGPALFDPASVDEPPPSGPIPHVLVAVPDSGINPYHEIYYRPNLTVHPCTYIEDFPCEIPALPLSVGLYDTWADAYAADAALWESLEYLQWYWIPQTVFVAVMCEGTASAADDATTDVDLCLIDDSSMHGTGTTSSILTENPNALIAFKEGNSGTGVFEDGYLPIDVLSYSWGAAVPLPTAGIVTVERDYAPFFVAASGNEGAFPVVVDGQKASQAVITVGAADAASRTEPGYSGWKTADFVSQYCRPTAQTKSVHAYRASYCGTSFAAPTFAGALSKVILELRRESGYTGSVAAGMVDPILGVSKWDVREALNLTATYAPAARFPAAPDLVPLVAAAPAYQWGWGYYDSTRVDVTLACIRVGDCPEKDAATGAFMSAVWIFRDFYGGWTLFDTFFCLLDDEAACARHPDALRPVLDPLWRAV